MKGMRIWSVIQLIIGLLAILSFVILAVGGEPMLKWIPTLILAVVLTILGIKGIRESRG